MAWWTYGARGAAADIGRVKGMSPPVHVTTGGPFDGAQNRDPAGAWQAARMTTVMPDVSVDDFVRLVVASGQATTRYRAALRSARAALGGQPILRDLMVERLKQEADRHWVIDPHISLRLGRTIVLVGYLTADARTIALGTMARADGIRLLGEPRFALQLCERAGILFKHCGDEGGWARTRISRMGALMVLGQLQEALAAAMDARSILERQRDRLRLARLDLNIAFVYDLLGQREDALRRWEEVITTCAEIDVAGSDELLEMAQDNRAMTLHRLGRLHEASQALEKARIRYVARGRQLQLANVNWLIGYVALFQGRYGPALRALDTAQVLWETLLMPVDAARVGCEVLECYLATGMPERVQELAPAYIAVLDRHNQVLDHALASMHQAEALRLLNQPVQSLAMLSARDSRLARAGLPVWRARAALGRGQALLMLGTVEAMHDAEVAARSALHTFQEARLPVEAAQALLLQARTQGRTLEARDLARQALRSALGLGLPGLVVSAHALMGELCAANGDAAAAASSYTAAIGVLEEMQQYMPLDLRRDFLAADPKIIYREAIRLAIARHSFNDLFDLVERAKSRALLDHLDRAIDPRPHGLDAVGERLLAELRAARERYQLLLATLRVRVSERASSLLPSQEYEETSGDLRTCEEQMRALIERIEMRNPAYHDGATLRGVRTLDPRPYLQPDHLFVSYYAVDDDLMILVVDDEGATSTLVAGVWSAICRDIRLLHLNLETASLLDDDRDNRGRLQRLEDRARRLLRRLWQAVLAPIGGRVERAARLTVAPYGPLHHLPFQALHDGEHYVIERLPVSVVPSGSVLAALHRRAANRANSSARHRAPGAALLVGNTQGGRLPYVAEEIALIFKHIGGHVLLDGDATREALRDRIEATSVLHLATHGALHPRDARFSFVEMADGRLSAAEIVEMRLHCELVTLSACESGRGDLGGGDDLVGLSRALLYAGADALILSLWRVEDQNTARLMEALYGGLAAGQAKDEALRHAQVSLLTRDMPSGQMPRTHPYFWASFMLVGTSRPIVWTA